MLQPTAALWWMAGCAAHVRTSSLHKWKYEVEHGADLTSTLSAIDHEGTPCVFTLLT